MLQLVGFHVCSLSWRPDSLNKVRQVAVILHPKPFSRIPRFQILTVPFEIVPRARACLGGGSEACSIPPGPGVALGGHKHAQTASVAPDDDRWVTGSSPQQNEDSWGKGAAWGAVKGRPQKWQDTRQPSASVKPERVTINAATVKLANLPSWRRSGRNDNERTAILSEYYQFCSENNPPKANH